MKIVQGNKLLEMTQEELVDKTKHYEKVVLDLGTGDGRYVYKSATDNPKSLYIGVDPSHPQLAVYSKRAVKDKLSNVLFVIGSIEVFPKELYGLADVLMIILPWGTLLQSIVLPKMEELTKMNKMLNEEGTAEMVFGYSMDAEPSEVIRLKLDNLSLEYLKTKVVPKFIEVGFSSATLSDLNKQELASFESTWSKRLRFGQTRPLYHLKLAKSVLS